jgi:hypothetical protein
MPRSITLLCLFIASLLSCAAFGEPAKETKENEEGFRPIFDGKTLDKWDGNRKLWRVEDGMIVGETTADNPTKGNTFLIWRGGAPGDFELKAEFCMPGPGFANSGIQIRSWEGPAKWQVSGYQCDMNDSDQYTGICYGENFRGILALRGQKAVIGNDHRPRVVEQFGDSNEVAKAIKKHDWNEYHIIAQGNRIIQKINGQLMCEVVDEDGAARKDGIIALQIHAGPPMKVQFRNLRIKEPSKAAGTGQAGADVKKKLKKIVFIAGQPSHGYAEHEHCAGCLLLADALKAAVPNVETAVYQGGWPRDAKAIDDADAVVIFSDGSKSHPLLKQKQKPLKQLERMMERGVGLACIHYAVTLTPGRPTDLLMQWIGGCYDPDRSVNPFWTAEFKTFSDHPICRGLKPFSIEDEWYFNIRFLDGMEGVTPILTAVPPDAARERPDGPNSNNPAVRAEKGKAEHVAWARVRPDGGRGFGMTGGHWHWNWGNDNFRTVALNGIAWAAKIDVPAGGIPSKTPSLKDLRFCQDKPEPENIDLQKVKKLLESWKSK